MTVCAWCGLAIGEDEPYVHEGERYDHPDPCYGLRMRHERDAALMTLRILDLLAEGWKRSSDETVKRLGADLKQVLDGP